MMINSTFQNVFAETLLVITLFIVLDTSSHKTKNISRNHLNKKILMN